MRDSTKRVIIYVSLFLLISAMVVVYKTCSGMTFAVTLIISVIVYALIAQPLLATLPECKDPPTTDDILIDGFLSVLETSKDAKVEHIHKVVSPPAWKCTYCGTSNLPVSSRCSSCGAPCE